MILGSQYRAVLFSHYLTEYLKREYPKKNFDHPKKHFIFGNPLYVRNENARNGIVVKWSFHVALAVKIKDSEALLILDPALSAKPMTKANFHQMLDKPPSQHSQISGFVTCNANTIGIESICVNPPNKQQTGVLTNPKINVFLDR